MSNQRNCCGKCEKFVGFGSAVVLRYGQGGRVHPQCVPEGKVTLAHGSIYLRPTALAGNAGTGTLNRGAA